MDLVDIILKSNPRNFHEALNYVVEKILEDAREKGCLRNERVYEKEKYRAWIEENTIHAKMENYIIHYFPVYPAQYYIEERDPTEFCKICREMKEKGFYIYPLTLEQLNPRKIGGKIFELTDRISYYHILDDPEIPMKFLEIIATLLDFPEILEFEKFPLGTYIFGEYELKIEEASTITKMIELILHGYDVDLHIRRDWVQIQRTRDLKILKTILAELKIAKKGIRMDVENLSRIMI